MKALHRSLKKGDQIYILGPKYKFPFKCSKGDWQTSTYHLVTIVSINYCSYTDGGLFSLRVKVGKKYFDARQYGPLQTITKNETTAKNRCLKWNQKHLDFLKLQVQKLEEAVKWI